MLHTILAVVAQTNLNFPRNPTLDNGFAIPNIPNDVVKSALDGPAPTTTTFKPSKPFATVAAWTWQISGQLQYLDSWFGIVNFDLMGAGS
ncbi:hypothetical protein HBH64_103880 [Parastagonospora nodorum]|nr:hypothetical protein HBI10_122860 [Parastagonospora nodorum]KAH4284853.1 hypothetical protein HBI02_240050 [Parastagonospora nodorum]KAH4300002.1 hypothetical protein HBI01_114980 [Parastagonospora nodorum]KAH4320614.1 hypothetical protein HBI00_224930 [Parastagonospora nodorum]KAH4370530.1 hypothetical protein HBH94_127290 [Parastagonospora nodorum]